MTRNKLAGEVRAGLRIPLVLGWPIGVNFKAIAREKRGTLSSGRPFEKRISVPFTRECAKSVDSYEPSAENRADVERELNLEFERLGLALEVQVGRPMSFDFEEWVPGTELQSGSIFLTVRCIIA